MKALPAPLTEAKIRKAISDYLAELGRAMEHRPAGLRNIEAALPRATRIICIGNGGSWTNAQAAALAFERAGLDTAAVDVDLSAVTSQQQFEEEIARGLARRELDPCDALVAFSGSGNSPNLLNAFTYASGQGAACWGFGGRDGGKMLAQLGRLQCLIAPATVMETIEDLNLIQAEALALALAAGSAEPAQRTGASASTRFTEAFRTWSSSSNIAVLTAFALSAVRTLFDESFCFIAGADIGSRHLRADMGRGWTNTLPCRGFAAPELYTDNSGGATANDDGIEYVLVDGLAKYARPGAPDEALVVNLPGQRQYAAPVLELLGDCGVEPYILVSGEQGPRCIDAAPLLEAGLSVELVTSHIGHMLGAVLRPLLQEAFEVQPVPASAGIDLGGRRKPTAKETRQFEEDLIRRGLLEPGRVLTFAYGQVFSARDPKGFGLRRVHY